MLWKWFSLDQVYIETDIEADTSPQDEQMPDSMVVWQFLCCVECNPYGIGDATGENPAEKIPRDIRNDVVPEQDDHPSHGKVEHDVQYPQ
jgi:hypothetical protein